jgi:Uma2 family endonuclease
MKGTAPLPLQGTMAGFRRFSVAEYHRLIQLGILTEDDNLELLEGYLVHKMSRNPPHDGTIQKLMKQLLRALTPSWELRLQCAVTLPESEPEPDLAVVRGDENTYLTHHPSPADVGLLIEVSDSTLDGDRTDKGRIYARSGIVCYWIVNLIDSQIEVYSLPSGPTADPHFAQRVDYRKGDTIPLTLDGITVAHLAGRDLLP